MHIFVCISCHVDVTNFGNVLLIFSFVCRGLKLFFLFLAIFKKTFWREYGKKLKDLMLVHLSGLDTAPPSRADRPWQTFSMVKSCCLLYRVPGRITWVAECKELRAVPATLWVLHYSLHVCCQVYWVKMFMVAIYTFWLVCLSIWNNVLCPIWIFLPWILYELYGYSAFFFCIFLVCLGAAE